MESRAPYPRRKAFAKSYQAHKPKPKPIPKEQSTRQVKDKSSTESSESEATPMLDRVRVLARRRAGAARHEAAQAVKAERQRHVREVQVPAFQRDMEEEARKQEAETAKLQRMLELEDRKWELERVPTRLSRAEVDRAVWSLVDAEGGLERRRGERKRAWRARIGRLNHGVQKLWVDNLEQLKGEEKRYVDGMPVREMIRRPVFRAHTPQPRSGLGACLQCSVKRMRCSRTRILPAPAPGASTRGPCRRCVRSGEPCLAPPGEDKSGEGEAEAEAEASPSESAGDKGIAEQERDRAVRQALDLMAGVKLDVGGGGRLVRAETARFALPPLGDEDEDEDGIVEPASCTCAPIPFAQAQSHRSSPANETAMPPPPDLSAYRLPDADSQRIFQSEILPAELPQLDAQLPPSSPASSSVPLALLAVGQTGAGKTLLAQTLLGPLRHLRAPAPAPAHLIADTYKTYHPQYTRLMLSTPHLASPATGPDARKWLAMAAREVVRRRVDVLLESACRHPDDFAQLARIFHHAGYRLEVVLLAVPAPLSRLGIQVRFYEKLPEGQSRTLPVRLTPTKVHDDSYAGLLDAAAFLDEAAVADQVLVVRRGNLVAYGEEKGAEGKVAKGGGVAPALRRERERPLTQQEMRTALEDIQKLSAHEGASAQVEQVRAMLQPLTSDCGGEHGQFPELVPLEFGRHGQKHNVLRLGQL
ncbi:hypothetical protein TOPH_03124 [Tolypocladium ophioglossoides CBS 100239]|uniref:Zeta toxin domain-containing protein n=1 Tax=Tolypocladium ophioglossoides (strain CBS 100239) TaxID=1163406 RepID=A0A0L0NE28_TOLOC|nr:hypothetical protein TOPH_03124 [Tolypocladium ophioglossoides CBS 100239]